MDPSRPSGAWKLHDIDHLRMAVRHGGDGVLVPPLPEWAALLLVDEPVRVLVLGDRRGHPERDAEVAGAPGDRVPRLHHTAGNSADRLPARRAHRGGMGAVRQRKVEAVPDRGRDHGAQPDRTHLISKVAEATAPNSVPLSTLTAGRTSARVRTEGGRSGRGRVS